MDNSCLVVLLEISRLLSELLPSQINKLWLIVEEVLKAYFQQCYLYWYTIYMDALIRNIVYIT